jgi:hypothetical protein
VANEYAAVLDLMDRLGMGVEDTREGSLVQIVEAASRWIDRQTAHRFYASTETRYYSPQSRYGRFWDDRAARPLALEATEYPSGIPGRIELDDVLTVTSVATDEDGDGVYEQVWTAGSDYWLGPRNAPANGWPYRYLNRNVANGRFLFPFWEESVQITGSFGFCTTATRPSEIRELCLMVSELMARPIMDMTMSGVGKYSVDQQYAIEPAEDKLPQLGMDILARYKAMSVF